MAKVEGATKYAKFDAKLVTITPNSLRRAATRQSEIGLTSLGNFEFTSPKPYLLMERDVLIRVPTDNDRAQFITSNYMYDAASRIFGPSFDSQSWRKVMLKNQDEMQVDKTVSFATSPYAHGFFNLAKTAATKIFLDGFDPAIEYIAARLYLIAKETKNDNRKQKRGKKVSLGDMSLKLSFVNSLDYTQKDPQKYKLAFVNKNLERTIPRLKQDRTDERKISLALERRLQIFAQMNNLQVMQPLLDDLAQDIITSATHKKYLSHTENRKSENVVFGETKRKRTEIINKPDRFIEMATPSLEYLARLARRKTIIQRPNERVGAFSKEWDHTQPAEIANSAMFVDTPVGKGWMPFETSIKLDPEALRKDEVYRQKMAKIKEIYIVQHGVMRNAKVYQRYFMEGLGKIYDPETMLVISPQFLAPVDLKEPKKLWDNTHKKMWGMAIDPDTVLRWRYNDWKGAEPAMNPDAPVDSFTAMDSLIEWILQFTPNAQTLEMRGNSEGGQFMDRYLAFSKTLNILQYTRKPPLRINGVLSNPGSLLHFTPTRPVFDKNGDITKWREYTFDSRENTWPFGMYDLTPYVSESLHEWPYQISTGYPSENTYNDPLEFAIWNYINRTTLAIGKNDNVVGGFHLPKGPGPAYYAQGNTRYRRMIGKFESLNMIASRKPRGYYPQPRMVELNDVEHDAWDVFRATEPYQQFLKAYKKYFGSIDAVH